MNDVLIWDLPTRVFHWLLAIGFAAAAGIALLLGEESPLFAYHAIIGLVLLMLVALRVVWGFVGSRWARFSSFAFGPAAVVGYLRGVLRSGGERHFGHNPASAWAIFAMLVVIIALASTGVMLGLGNEAVEELHEFLAYTTLGIVAVHIIGVIGHSVRHRENITASMLHGRKRAGEEVAIRSPYRLAAIVLLVVTAGWASALATGFNSATQSLRVPLVGLTLQIGESENESGERSSGYERELDDD